MTSDLHEPAHRTPLPTSTPSDYGPIVDQPDPLDMFIPEVGDDPITAVAPLSDEPLNPQRKTLDELLVPRQAIEASASRSNHEKGLDAQQTAESGLRLKVSHNSIWRTYALRGAFVCIGVALTWGLVRLGTCRTVASPAEAGDGRGACSAGTD